MIYSYLTSNDIILFFGIYEDSTPSVERILILHFLFCDMQALVLRYTELQQECCGLWINEEKEEWTERKHTYFVWVDNVPIYRDDVLNIFYYV